MDTIEAEWMEVNLDTLHPSFWVEMRASVSNLCYLFNFMSSGKETEIEVYLRVIKPLINFALRFRDEKTKEVLPRLALV